MVTKAAVSTAHPEPERIESPQERFDRGNKVFALLFTRWMDGNGWSHPVMVNLAKACLGGDKGWLHSSQISGLRHVKLGSPGPRTFIAIERLNFYIHRYATEKKLLPGTSSSNFYATAFAITENGNPPPVGWWVEVFCGERVPKDIDLHSSFFNNEQARRFSDRWAKAFRRQMMLNEFDVITDLDRTIREYYPAGDTARLEKLVAVIQNRATWEPDELSIELPAITQLLGGLGYAVSDEAQLITEFSQ